MKHSCKKLSIAIIFFLSASYFFSFTPHRIFPIDTRSKAMGGSHGTDFRTVYALFNNPAEICFAKEKVLWPSIAIQLDSAPMDIPAYFSLIPWNNLNIGDPQTFLAKTTSPLWEVSQKEKRDSEYSISGPITAAYFKEIKGSTIGFGLINNSFAKAKTHNSRQDFYSGINTKLQLSYARLFDMEDAGIFSFGLTAHGTHQIESNTVELKTLPKKIDLQAIPAYEVLGWGFDLGVTYKKDWFQAAIICTDIYSPVYIWKYNGLNSLLLHSKGSFLEEKLLTPGIELCTGFSIPLKEKTKNTISNFDIYVDFNNLLPLFSNNESITAAMLLSEISIGSELSLFDIVSFRLGLNKRALSVGIGVRAKIFTIDFAVFDYVIGNAINSTTPLQSALTLSFNY